MHTRIWVLYYFFFLALVKISHKQIPNNNNNNGKLFVCKFYLLTKTTLIYKKWRTPNAVGKSNCCLRNNNTAVFTLQSIVFARTSHSISGHNSICPCPLRLVLCMGVGPAMIWDSRRDSFTFAIGQIELTSKELTWTLLNYWPAAAQMAAARTGSRMTRKRNRIIDSANIGYRATTFTNKCNWPTATINTPISTKMVMSIDFVHPQSLLFFKFAIDSFGR